MEKWPAVFKAVALFFLPIVLGCLIPVDASARALHCDLEIVKLEAADIADGQAACRGVGDAVAFLKRQGLTAENPIRLKIVDRLPAVAGPSAIGIYLPKTKTAYLLRHSRLGRKIRHYEMPLSGRLYQSLATHEVTHALTDGMFSQAKPMIFAREYIAYVAMLDSMTPQHRNRLLAMFPGKGFERESHINIVTYQFDPLQFGVFSYRHYLRPENGPAFIRRILAGEALARDAPM